MDETTLQESIYKASNDNNDLENIILWALQMKYVGAKDDVKTIERCWDLTKSISVSLKVAKKEAENAKNISHYIADKAIKDAVSRLGAQLRSQDPQNPVVAFVVAIFFESPQSNDKRKDLEARIKAKMGLSILEASDDESEEFAEKMEVFEEKSGELALEFAIEDAKKMVDEDLRMLAMA